MAYQNPIVCKEIYLPIGKGERLTNNEYRTKYGIDLRDIFALDGNDKLVIKPLIKLFIVFGEEKRIISPVVISRTAYSAGENDESLQLTDGIYYPDDNKVGRGEGVVIYIQPPDPLSADYLNIVDYDSY